jgi:hypothetical protein
LAGSEGDCFSLAQSHLALGRLEVGEQMSRLSGHGKRINNLTGHQLAICTRWGGAKIYDLGFWKTRPKKLPTVGHIVVALIEQN